MKNEEKITPEILRALLSYNSRTGHFIWKVRDVKWSHDQSYCDRWNKQFAGRPAFCAIGNKGYRNGTVLGVVLSAHRAAFAIHYGRWPADLLDHKNGDRADCRILNLREGSYSINGQNRRPARSIPPGVYFHKRAGKWMASIMVQKRQHYLGLFVSMDGAARARKKAERKFGYMGRAS